VLGPLPKFYRVAVSGCALVVLTAFGAWAAFTLPVPILAVGGGSIGAALGVIVVVMLLHDFGALGSPGESPARRDPDRA